MLNFSDLSKDKFLSEYWQKNPLVIRNAITTFENPLTPEELAGLAMEEEPESRIVFETPDKAPYWSLKRGPFTEEVFTQLPESHWTLLVQGVDRFIPEVAAVLDHFDFLPAFRVDDVMISYAAEMGSVGPHYDNYDVFLYQAKGRRKWLLTTQDCVDSNYQEEYALRIMKTFRVEQEFILEEGDMLYLPPHVGHHGISLSHDCMTWSIGYRSYQGQELWDSFGEFCAAQQRPSLLYKDPLWRPVSGTTEVPQAAWLRARETLTAMLGDDNLLKNWFGSFLTSLDHQAESLLPESSSADGMGTQADFMAGLNRSKGLLRHPVCRFAYINHNQHSPALFINGCGWNTENVSAELVKYVANNRNLAADRLLPFMDKDANQHFLYELWTLQWLEFLETVSVV